MFTPLSISACNLNPGDMIRFTTPEQTSTKLYPVRQGIVTHVSVDEFGTTRVSVRLPMINQVADYYFPSDQYVDVTGQLSQEALDYMEDFRKFQP